MTPAVQSAATSAAAGRGRVTARWLTAFGLAVVVGQHLGALPGGLGPAGGGTRWVDWLDLLTPYAVVGSALAALASAGDCRREWALLGWPWAGGRLVSPARR